MRTEQQRPPKEAIGAILEPVEGWWTSNTAWGKRFTGDMPEAIVPQPAPIDLFELKAAPGPPRSIGVQLYRSDKQVALGANCDVHAQVTYGAGGTSNTFLLDWSAGAGFTLLANTLRISIAPYRPVLDVVYSPLKNVILGATVGLGVTSNNHPVFTPRSKTQLNPGFTQQFAIPDFATGVHVMCFQVGPLANFDLSNLFIEFRSSSGATIDVQRGDVVAGSLFSVEGLRIPGSAQFVAFFTDVAFVVPFMCQFVLGL
jgi:hypothetical protein